MLETMVCRSCRVCTYQGGEWARLRYRFADHQTVNHSLEWVTADGVTTNLGEAYNGVLKKLGSSLNLWKGQSTEPDLDMRWQELAWRVNSGVNRAETPAGDRMLALVSLLAAAQTGTQGTPDGSRPAPQRLLDSERVVAPEDACRLQRFPAKRSAGLRKVWRMLRQWMKSREMELVLPDFSKEERCYVHRWCSCWVGLEHVSVGPDHARVLTVRRTQAVCQRQ